MSDLTPKKLDELRRLAATAADATTERTPWYSADDLLTHGVESEDDAPYIAALTPPIVLELLDAATERDALAAKLAHMTEARDNARAEVERLTALVRNTRAYCEAFVEGSEDSDPDPWNPAAYVLGILDGNHHDQAVMPNPPQDAQNRP